MSKPKTIQDIIDTLSPEEKELNKDIIDECIRREMSIIENAERCRRTLEELHAKMLLLSIPDDRFFKC